MAITNMHNIAGQTVGSQNVYRNTVQKTGDKKVSLVEYGYRPDGEPIPLEYLAKVTSIRNLATVISPLQEDIHLRVDSRWQPLVPTSLLGTANTLVQALTGGRHSVITRATSRRIWVGTSPISLSLKMRFEATESPADEVREPVRLLQSMVLPSELGDENPYVADVGGGIKMELPILSPPGPTPFTLDGILNSRDPSRELGDVTEIIEGLKGGDKIIVELGRFLTFYNVIIREARVTVPIKFDKNGDPISATVGITFETYEIMTAESLGEAYRKTVISGANTSQELGGSDSKIVSRF